MGSSTSKPRKKGNHNHLAKVGTPANQAYEQEVRRGYFGGRWAWAVGLLFALAIIALLVVLTLL
jgi:hypothetical protein